MMGGGMMSVPPTGLPYAPIDPGQTSRLNTRLVSLAPPDQDGLVVFPAEGEKLELGEVSQTRFDARSQAALRRLAEDKAPTVVSQLVMWNVAGHLSWEAIAVLSKEWANVHEMAMARGFVARLDASQGDLPRDSKSGVPDKFGSIYFEFESTDASSAAIAKELRDMFEGKRVFGLKSTTTVPSRPADPSVLCKVRLGKRHGRKLDAVVSILISDGKGTNWAPGGKFTLADSKPSQDELKADEIATSIGEGVLGRLVHVELKNGPKYKGKPTHRIQILNASPLILNGLAIGGVDAKDQHPSVLSGVCIGPRRGISVPATAQIVESLGLKNGVRVLAVDLSGL
jgi:hypothetical protein